MGFGLSAVAGYLGSWSSRRLLGWVFGASEVSCQCFLSLLITSMSLSWLFGSVTFAGHYFYPKGKYWTDTASARSAISCNNPMAPCHECNQQVLGPKYYNMNGIWALKPTYLGPGTLREGCHSSRNPSTEATQPWLVHIP